MIRLLTILLLFCSVAQGQNLRKIGSSGATHNYYGIHRYSIHPSWSLSDSLWLVNRKYVDSLVEAAIDAIEPASSGYGIDSTVIGGTVGSILYVKSGPTLGQNNTLLNWDNTNSIFTTGHIRNTTTNTYDIGTASQRYRNLWVNGINLNVSGTATANQVWFSPGSIFAATQTPSASGADVISFQSSAQNSSTAGTTNLINISVAPFGPSSGTHRWNTIRIHNVINQTGTANGLVRGIFDTTRLTSVVEYRAYENAFGTVYLNSVSGGTGVGALPGARKFYVGGSVGIRKDSVTLQTTNGPRHMLVIDTTTDRVERMEIPAGGGGISGSGTSGRVAYWDGGSSITSDANFLYSNSGAGTLSVGTTNTQGHFNIGGNKNISSSGFVMYLAPARYTDNITAASGTAGQSWTSVIMGKDTIAATNSDVSVASPLTLLVDAPVAGTNVTFITPPLAISTNGAVQISGGIKRSYAGIAAGTTNITYLNDIIQCNATSGNVTATLPNSTIYSGFTFTFIRTDNTVNTVTINTTSSQTINGTSSYTLDSQYKRVTVVSDGSNWLIINSN